MFKNGAFTVRQRKPKRGPAIIDLVLGGGSFAACAPAAKSSGASAASAA